MKLLSERLRQLTWREGLVPGTGLKTVVWKKEGTLIWGLEPGGGQ